MLQKLKNTEREREWDAGNRKSKNAKQKNQLVSNIHKNESLYVFELFFDYR